RSAGAAGPRDHAPRRGRQQLVLRHRDGASWSEIGARLGLSEAEARARFGFGVLRKMSAALDNSTEGRDRLSVNGPLSAFNVGDDDRRVLERPLTPAPARARAANFRCVLLRGG